MKRDTKNIILEAAKEIFFANGYEGARMRDMAEKANINKGLLHYYFRTKHSIFIEVLKSAAGHIFPKINDIIVSNISFYEKLGLIVDVYIELLSQNLKLSSFVVSEMNYNTEIFIKAIVEAGLLPDISEISKIISYEVKEYKIDDFDAFGFILNGLSMMIFPFLIRPLIKKSINISDEEFTNIMRLRKRIIVDTLINNLKN